MKILVFSDTHGDMQGMTDIITNHPEAEAVFHLGDCFRDMLQVASHFPSVRFYCVRGNCDSASDGIEERLLVVEGGCRFLLTHGHHEQVKYGLLRLEMAAREQAADVALFGHTHVPLLDNGRVILFNPGSLSQPRGGSKASWGMIETEGGVPHFSFHPRV